MPHMSGLLLDLFVAAQSPHLRRVARHGHLHARQQDGDRRTATPACRAAGVKKKVAAKDETSEKETTDAKPAVEKR